MPLLVKYTTIQSPFRHPFTISKGTKTHQPALLTRLTFNGVDGYGEAPAITYYNIPLEKMVSDLEQKKMLVEKYAFNGVERYWHYLHHLFPQNNFLVCALDIACWDMFGKLNNKPLYQLWNSDIKKLPVTDYTIGIDAIDKMVAKMQEMQWPVYKIKLGTVNDIEIIEALRRHTNAPLRIDANAAWQKEEALEKINVFKDMNIEFIEQPLAKDDWEGMRWLYNQSALPLIADESCVYENDVEKCRNYFHGINIKLTKCGGITPAMRMIAQAKNFGMKTMLGCMNESTIGTAAIAHLAPMVDFIDADGPLLLNEDVATGLHYNYGNIQVSQNAGLGITVHDGLFV
jgi:L-Ala-D/L-Glu epimerase